MTDEVGSIGPACKEAECPGIARNSQPSEEEVLVLPSVPTAGQLLSSNSISENQVNSGKSNTKDSAQATAGVEEIILLDPP